MSDMGGSQGAGGVGGRPSMGQTAEMGGAREIEHGCHGQPGLQRSGCGGRHGSMEGMGGNDDHGSSTMPTRRSHSVYRLHLSPSFSTHPL
jgi:hypothetical protein